MKKKKKQKWTTKERMRKNMWIKEWSEVDGGQWKKESKKRKKKERNINKDR